MKQHSLRNHCVLIALTLCCIAINAQTSVAFNCIEDKGSVSANGSGKPDEISKDGITISTTNGVFGNGTDYRIYSGATLTISSSGNEITEITVTSTYTKSNGTNKLSGEGYTFANDFATGTWTGNSMSVSLKASAQTRLKTITVKTGGQAKASTTVTFGEYDGQTIDVAEGEESAFSSPKATLTPAEAGKITYSSSNESIAKVDPSDGNITFGSSTGKTTITATFAGNDTYASSSAHYTINRTKNLSNSIFHESFDLNSNTGGNDNKWSGSIANSTAITTDNEGWTLTKAYAASQCLKLGTSSTSGSATTPAITRLNGDATLTFKAGAWTGDRTTLAISISGGGSLSQETVELHNGEWQDYTLYIIGGTPSTQITFTGTGRFFIDEVTITLPGAGTTPVAAPSASLNDGLYISEQQVTLTAGDGCKIYYTTNGESPTAESNAYTSPITLNTTTTLKAIAYSPEGNASPVTTHNYEFPVKCANIADAKKLTSGTAIWLTLTGAQVVYANVRSNTEYYLRDATGAINLFNTGLQLAGNQVVNGTLVARYVVFNGMPELTSTEYTSPDALDIADGDSPTPHTATTADIAAGKYACDLVTISGCTVSIIGRNTYAGSGNDAIQIYDKFKTGSYTAIYANANIDITGICIPYKDTYQIAPVSERITYNFAETAENYAGSVNNATVRLTRTLSSEHWNTLCVPFDIAPEQVESVLGEGTKITEFSGNTDGNTMLFTDANGIEAGKPYLIKAGRTTQNPVFTGVNISDVEPQSIASPNGYRFTGTYSPITLATDGSDLFVSRDGNLKQPGGTEAGANTIKGLRAYITIPAGTAAKSVSLNIDGTATGISHATPDDRAGGSIYRLDGRRAGSGTTALPKGIYIRDGKKLIIK